MSMTSPSHNLGPSHNPGEALGHLKLRWGWLVGLGVVLVIAGVIALLSVVAATIVSVLWVGAVMIVAGVVEIVHGFRMKGFGRALLWVFIGALYIFGGFFAMMNPLLASTVLTLVLSIALIIAGIVRIILGFHLKAGQHGGLVIFSGIVTTLFGLIILIHWPLSSLFALGVILGIDLIVAGFVWINMGLFLKRRA
jgi:uncharacterized membrane protein HdeD (DUF308 family)